MGSRSHGTFCLQISTINKCRIKSGYLFYCQTSALVTVTFRYLLSNNRFSLATGTSDKVSHVNLKLDICLKQRLVRAVSLLAVTSLKASQQATIYSFLWSLFTDDVLRTPSDVRVSSLSFAI